MAKYCPVSKRKVTYLDCQDCEEKECKEPHLAGENNERKTSIRNFNDGTKKC